MLSESLSGLARTVRSGRNRLLAADSEMLAQSLSVRFFEAAEQHHGPSASRFGTKPTGCKQPVGTATATMRLRRVGRVRVVRPTPAGESLSIP